MIYRYLLRVGMKKLSKHMTIKMKECIAKYLPDVEKIAKLTENKVDDYVVKLLKMLA